MKFDWNRARAFLATAEEGSLSAASRALGMTQPTLGRQVSALEEELGVVLFERIGGGLVLTPSGLELLDHVRGMGEAANRVALAASGQSQSLDGDVCIAASDSVAAFILVPIVEQLRRIEPGIRIELVTSVHASDLMRREADIAIRHFRPVEAELIARKLTGLSARLYASKAYLELIGWPKNPAELEDADFICFDKDSIDGFIGMYKTLGLNLTKRNFPVLTRNELVAWELVKQGVAIGIIEEEVGDAEATVQRVLPELAPVIAPIWLTVHRELRTSKRIRRVYDFLAEELLKR